jgi:hypothetical protein
MSTPVATRQETSTLPVGDARKSLLGLPDGVFATGLAVLLGYAEWLGRDISFFSDDWPIIAFHHNGDYVTPYGGHLLLLPIAIFHTLFVTVGLTSYTPYLVVGLVSYATFAVVLYIYLRRRVQPTLACIAALSVVWFSTAQLNVLFPLLLNFSIPMAATVLIWMCLDRNDVRFDLAAAGFLAIALACGGVGLVPVAAVATELLVHRAPIKRWLPFAVPVALWCLWYAAYHTPVGKPNSFGGTIRFSLHQIQATFAGFAGGWDVGGYMLLGAMFVVFALAILRWHTFNARAAAALVSVVVFAGLTGYTAIHGSLPALPADTPRYLWVNAFLLVTASVEVIRGRRLSPTVAVVGAVVLAVGAVTLVGNLQTYHREVVQYKHSTRTFLVATEAISDRIDRHRILPLSYNLVRTGEYLAAVKHLGSPLHGVGVRDLGTEADRKRADGWMIQDLGLSLAPGPVQTTSSCTAVTPATQPDFSLRGPAAIVARAGPGPAVLSLRRLSQGFDSPIGRIEAGTMASLRIPADRSSLPWHIRIDGVTESLAVCR